MAIAALSNEEKNAVFSYLKGLQQTLVTALAAVDNRSADCNDWRSALGSGRMCTFSRGDVFERGGVNFSSIQGDQLPAAASIRHPELAGHSYQAGGVSLVLHPANPYCPTVHMNVRCFITDTLWWFGGGMDLTPYYGFIEDCRHFHTACRNALDARDKTLYPKFKKNCDEYFFIRHRDEARGIGGVFFDDFNEHSFQHAFNILQAVGDSLIPAYVPIVEKRRRLPYGEQQRNWQKHRRGRYAEFNLVYDRGTLFGLQSGGRADAVLMSLPPEVSWGEAQPPPGQAERALLADFLPPRDWCQQI